MKVKTMTPLPLSVNPPNPLLSPGDIVEFEGSFNRPPVKSLAWWAMLLFGPPFACRHLGWAFRRKASDPFYHIPTRRNLFRERALQRYVITGEATSG